jgi:hypothetical protein
MIVSENKCGICKHIHIPGETKCGWKYALKRKTCQCQTSLKNGSKIDMKDNTREVFSSG